MKADFNALTLSHDVITRHVKPGDSCIDATAGRGRDTLFLCRLVGENGRVTAFDIQKEAVDSTNALLAQDGFDGVGRAILDSHANMEKYVSGPVQCITFNLGWLPGGDHSVFTTPQTSIPAIQAGLRLLAPGGLMSICIYYGRDCGFAERDALLEYLPTVDSGEYSVLITQFANRPNNPPIPVFIWRDR